MVGASGQNVEFTAKWNDWTVIRTSSWFEAPVTRRERMPCILDLGNPALRPRCPELH